VQVFVYSVITHYVYEGWVEHQTETPSAAPAEEPSEVTMTPMKSY
jgi:hypothetical protein